MVGRSSDADDELFLQAATRLGFDISLQLIVAAGQGKTNYVFWLLHHGADVKTASPNLHRTALMQAAAGGYVYLVQVLLANGSDPNAFDLNGQTALIYAAANANYHGDYTVKELLVGGADVNHAGRFGVSALMEAVAGGYVPLVQRLVKAGANVDASNTAVYTAWINLGSSGIVGFETVTGTTALMLATKSDRVDIAHVLIRAGADVNSRSSSGYSALMLAAESAHSDIGKVLIEAGADVNTSNSNGDTPLILGVVKNSVDFVRMLIAAGADVNKTNINGSTPLTVAQQYGYVDIANLLYQAGARNKRVRCWGKRYRP